MKGTAFTVASRKLLDYVTENAEHLPEFLQHITREVLFPLLGLLLCLWMVAYLCKRIYRKLYPLTAAQLYAQALKLLQSRRRGRHLLGRYITNDDDRTALALLWQALERDASYIPAMQSLAAYYIYRSPNAAVAMKILKLPAATANARDDDFRELRMDAEALASGNAVMIQNWIGEAEYLSMKRST
jgi:hypothetical protein